MDEGRKGRLGDESYPWARSFGTRSYINALGFFPNTFNDMLLSGKSLHWIIKKE